MRSSDDGHCPGHGCGHGHGRQPQRRICIHRQQTQITDNRFGARITGTATYTVTDTVTVTDTEPEHHPQRKIYGCKFRLQITDDRFQNQRQKQMTDSDDR